MPDWTATGAGDATYNKDYTESGAYGGKAAYVYDLGGGGERWLYWDGGVTNPGWCLDATKWSDGAGRLDHPYYGNGAAALPDNPWTVGPGGTEAAPTVAAYEAGGGGGNYYRLISQDQ